MGKLIEDHGEIVLALGFFVIMGVLGTVYDLAHMYFKTQTVCEVSK